MRQRNIKNMEKQPGVEQFSLLYTTLNLESLSFLKTQH